MLFRLLITILTIPFLISCNDSPGNKVPTQDTLPSAPAPGKDLIERSDDEQILKRTDCNFSNPDTALSKIKLRDSESAGSIISEKENIDDYDQYHYYSKTGKETLTLTQHPGDGKYQISIFKVEKSDKANHDYRKLSVETFTTEKGIQLGMNKNQVIERLGSCYITRDSAAGYIELYYRLETPDDSQTKILENNNMPIYYASYKFWKDQLGKFEFGFEYP